jgi:hypothetical protein
MNEGNSAVLDGTKSHTSWFLTEAAGFMGAPQAA